MRPLIAFFYVLFLTVVIAVQVGAGVSAGIGRLTDAVSLSSRSVAK